MRQTCLRLLKERWYGGQDLLDHSHRQIELLKDHLREQKLQLAHDGHGSIHVDRQ